MKNNNNNIAINILFYGLLISMAIIGSIGIFLGIKFETFVIITIVADISLGIAYLIVKYYERKNNIEY